MLQPVFDSDQYHVQVPENAPSNVSIFSLRATDLDSNEFGEVSYSLSGAGSEMFFVNPATGEIGVASCGLDVDSDDDALCLDHESKSSYSLMYKAADGGGKHVSVKLVIEVLDVNDNAVSEGRNQTPFFRSLTCTPVAGVSAADLPSDEHVASDL